MDPFMEQALFAVEMLRCLVDYPSSVELSVCQYMTDMSRVSDAVRPVVTTWTMGEAHDS